MVHLVQILFNQAQFRLGEIEHSPGGVLKVCHDIQVHQFGCAEAVLLHFCHEFVPGI